MTCRVQSCSHKNTCSFDFVVACSRRSDNRARTKNQRRKKLGETREGKGEGSLALAPVLLPFSPVFPAYDLTRSTIWTPRPTICTPGTGYHHRRGCLSSLLSPCGGAVPMSLFQSLFCLCVYLFIYLSLLAGGLPTCAIFLKLFRKRISCVSVLMICSLYFIFDKIFLVR